MPAILCGPHSSKAHTEPPQSLFIAHTDVSNQKPLLLSKNTHRIQNSQGTRDYFATTYQAPRKGNAGQWSRNRRSTEWQGRCLIGLNAGVNKGVPKPEAVGHRALRDTHIQPSLVPISHKTEAHRAL